MCEKVENINTLRFWAPVMVYIIYCDENFRDKEARGRSKFILGSVLISNMLI